MLILLNKLGVFKCLSITFVPLSLIFLLPSLCGFKGDVYAFEGKYNVIQRQDAVIWKWKHPLYIYIYIYI